MHDLKIAADDVMSYLSPDGVLGAAVYLLLFVAAALLLARVVRAAVHGAIVRQGHIDRTTLSFLQQIATAAIWVIMLILYAHLIPVLRAMGTALLAGASVASVVIGLAAQSTLGNLVAGVAITIYRPFHLGDTLQVTAPTGTETGTVELISLGYTTLRTGDGRRVVLPNSIAASQVCINLSEPRTPAPLAVVIEVSRASDLESVRELAQRVAREAAADAPVIGCFLTRIDTSRAVLELRVRVPQGADRDSLRSKLVAALAARFAATNFGAPSGQLPSFS
jgi:small conductance mechanosensitive channel